MIIRSASVSRYYKKKEDQMMMDYANFVVSSYR